MHPEYWFQNGEETLIRRCSYREGPLLWISLKININRKIDKLPRGGAKSVK